MFGSLEEGSHSYVISSRPQIQQTQHSKDKKKLGEGSYGSVSKATNISTKAFGVSMMRNHVRRISHYVGQATAYNCMIHDVMTSRLIIVTRCANSYQAIRAVKTISKSQMKNIERFKQAPNVQPEIRFERRTVVIRGAKRKGSEIRRLPSWRWWTTPTSSSSMSPSRILGLAMTWICNMQISSDITI